MAHTNHLLFQVEPLTAPWEEIGWKAVKTAFIEQYEIPHAARAADVGVGA